MTTRSHNSIMIIIIVAVSVVVPLVLSFVIIACIVCLCHKFELLSSKASVDSRIYTAPGSDTQSSQPAHVPVYETVMECTTCTEDLEMIESSQPSQPGPVYEAVMGCTTVDLEMIENVAYVPVHTLNKNINTS